MNCHYCLVDLSGATATATLPCCAKVVHTACLIREISNKISNDWGFIQCECNTNLWEAPYSGQIYPTQGAIEARVAVLIAQPDVRQEIKEIKKASSVMSKAQKAFGSYMKGIKASYKEQTEQYIIALRQIRDAMKSNIKQSAECKAHKKALTAINRLQDKFRTKYSLNSREFRHLFGYTNRSMPIWNYRYYTSERVIRRLLRILI
jgi:hypothetical protein